MLSGLSHFDLVHGFVTDFLHCALLGVARQLVSLWFDTSNHDRPWYIGQPCTLASYDARVKNVVVPKEWLPRSIQTGEHWKANEFKTFCPLLLPCCVTRYFTLSISFPLFSICVELAQATWHKYHP